MKSITVKQKVDQGQGDQKCGGGNSRGEGRRTQIVVVNELSFIKTMMFKERLVGGEEESHADT